MFRALYTLCLALLPVAAHGCWYHMPDKPFFCDDDSDCISGYFCNSQSHACEKKAETDGVTGDMGDMIDMLREDGENGNETDGQSQVYEFVVNTQTDDQQYSPAVAPLPGSGFVVVWVSEWQDSDGAGVFGQRFTESSKRLGSEFQVNSTVIHRQLEPAVASLTEGGFVVTWTHMDTVNPDIRAQRFTSDGEPTGNEFVVNSYAIELQQSPAVTGISDDEFVIVWQSKGQDTSGMGIFGQIYQADGSPKGSEFQVNSFTDQDQSDAAIAGYSLGKFVVTWMSEDQDGSEEGVYGQLLNATGLDIGSEFRVNTLTSSTQKNPAVAVLTDYNFVIVWEGNGGMEGTELYGIFGQRFSSTPSPKGDAFQINSTTTDWPGLPDIAPLESGGFVVVWTRARQLDGDGYGIFARIYDDSGNPLDDEFRVSSLAMEPQKNPKVAGLSDGGFVIVWSISGYRNDGTDIIALRFNAQGQKCTSCQ